MDHDDMLFSMLKECKTIPIFFDSIFGFLKRRTDFYLETTDPNSPVGLPNGLAEKIVQHTFFKWKRDNEYQYQVLSENDISVANEEIVDYNAEEVVIEDVTEAVKQISVKNQDFTSSECYNGAKYEDYTWSQTISDVNIIIKVPENTKTKDFSIDIQSNKIAVHLKNGTALLDGKLCQKCKHLDAIWSLDKCKLEIHLDKCHSMWWDCLIQSEAKLDISKIDCSRPYEDLSDEAQAKIEELQWNQDRKRLGLPTSEEIALHKTLEKAWNVDGSPFSGPFDPSSVIIN